MASANSSTASIAFAEAAASPVSAYTLAGVRRLRTSCAIAKPIISDDGDGGGVMAAINVVIGGTPPLLKSVRTDFGDECAGGGARVAAASRQQPGLDGPGTHVDVDEFGELEPPEADTFLLADHLGVG